MRALGHHRASLRRSRRGHHRDDRVGCTQPALEMAGIEGQGPLDAVIMRHGHLALPDTGGRTAARRAARQQGAASTSPPPAPAIAMSIALASDMVRTSQADNVPGPGRRAALRLHRPQGSRHRLHLRRWSRRGRGERLGLPGIGPTDLGIRRCPVGTRSRSARAGSTCTPRTSAGPTIGMAGQTVFRCGGLGMAPVAAARSTPRASRPINSMPSSPTRPTSGSSTR